MSLTEPSKTYKPQQYEWAVKAAEDSENLHWIHNEIDFSSDIADWKNNLTAPEKNLIHQILKLFTESDKTVAHMYTNNLIPYFKNNEIQQMLISFAAREGIHTRAYAALLETLNLPDTDFQAFLEYKEMSDKIDFMNDNDPKSQTGRALSLAKNIFSEGVSLFGTFIILLNFQRYGKMKGMNTVNRWSILDEQCLIGGTEVLTKTGWVNIEDITVDTAVLQYDVNDGGKMAFKCPTNLVKNNTVEMVEFENNEFHQVVTDGHRMILEQAGVSESKLAREFDSGMNVQDKFVISGNKIGGLSTLSEEHRSLIDQTKAGAIVLSDWILPILPEISSSWAEEFLRYYRT
jgi:ribonucleotide reductase beta subunit family protein with ferritin-like domain